MKTIKLMALLCCLISPAAYAVKDGDTFQDWVINCGKNELAPQQQCHMVQRLANKDGSTAMQILIAYTQKAENPVALLQLPLGTHLPAGIKMTIPGQEPTTLIYMACFTTGCQTSFVLEDSMLNNLKQGNFVVFSVRDTRGNEVKNKVSLAGFTAAVKAIKPKQ